MANRSVPILVLTLVLAAPAFAGEGEGSYILDEYVLDVQGGSDSLRVGAGLWLGNHLSGDWYGILGGRLSWLQFREGPDAEGVGLGVLTGVGYAPERNASPFLTVALDKPFGGADRYSVAATLTAGVRLRVYETDYEHYSIRFALFHAEVSGDTAPDTSDTGISVLYSVGLFGSR